MPWKLMCIMFALSLAAVAMAAPPASNLKAVCRSGQVFVTWDEPEGLSEVYFTVLLADQPITADNYTDATIAGHHIMPGEATDWWLNEETYGKPLEADAQGNKPAAPHEGWLLEEGGQRISADGGLFVHTVTDQTAGERYYAVVVMPDEGAPEIAAGVNSLTDPVTQSVATPEPIWQGDPAAKPVVGSGEGLPLDVPLHAKRGRGGMEWLMFGDSSLGWRDGLPFKFGSRVAEDTIQVSTTDRHWIARLLPDDMDQCNRLTPAIHSFWWGYNDHIYDPDLMSQGVCRGYAERRVLWMVKWAQDYFHTDPNRTYAMGGSMGGCASFNIAFHHPEVFAAIAPVVGIVEYKAGEGGDSARRIVAFTGPLDTPTDEGMTVGERLRAARLALSTTADLPYVVMVNGRNDGSIPWWVNPDFYRAMQTNHHGFSAAWNAGEHGTAQKMMAEDFAGRFSWQWLHNFALNKSYPAISNFSLDSNPGNGDKTDGDIEGYINRNLVWDDPVDTAEGYEVAIQYVGAQESLPVTMDVTPRRVQSFILRPGEKVNGTCTCRACKKVIHSAEMVADENGRVTYEGFRIISMSGAIMRLTRAQG